MPRRIIRSSAKDSSYQLITCLSDFLKLELLHPSPEFYLTSPWLSSFPLVDNRFGQFRFLSDGTNKKALGFSEVLVLLAERGTQVRIMCLSEQRETENFINVFRGNKNITIRYEQDLHEKSLVSRHFCESGSMNFTRTGVQIKREKVEFSTDQAEVALALLEVRRSWEGLSS
jgi:hypothetical protein